MMGIGSMY
jgi:hypothetical protein